MVIIFTHGVNPSGKQKYATKLHEAWWVIEFAKLVSLLLFDNTYGTNAGNFHVFVTQYNTCVPSMIHSARPTAITIFASNLFCFVTSWKAGTDVQTTRGKIVITSGRDCGSASWINSQILAFSKNENYWLVGKSPGPILKWVYEEKEWWSLSAQIPPGKNGKWGKDVEAEHPGPGTK